MFISPLMYKYLIYCLVREFEIKCLFFCVTVEYPVEQPVTQQNAEFTGNLLTSTSPLTVPLTIFYFDRHRIDRRIPLSKRSCHVTARIRELGHVSLNCLI
jgi:hypothetical protein